ncbi:HpyAIV family type II restriction enzyme [Metamycoplasma canadense]|uniref:type II site-specific deoxyribonuclease n=1 Tax=Metamycoplasma canadense TaxID=29554 RepID=A0A077LBX8_9BACT|nr:YraN family protein [Metamycoplasma canadense]BAP39629.1 type II restriction modification system endonuclease [Metamycoplasma canadense]
MIIEYKEFCDLLLSHIEEGQNFYISLLENIIANPKRYIGFFRLSNPKTKLIQNITQSREIKFGDFLENLVEKYIQKIGYKILNKNINSNINNEKLKIDLFFEDNNFLYLIEMKVRDDHDSAKKRGQFLNFINKLTAVKQKYLNKKIKAVMWFVDDLLTKNKKYYNQEISSVKIKNCQIFLCYGKEFLNMVNNGKLIWNELILLLKKYNEENIKNDVNIPDFGNSKQILNALLKIKNSAWKKLNSDNQIYKMLREEFFKNGNNLEEAKKMRNK